MCEDVSHSPLTTYKLWNMPEPSGTRNVVSVESSDLIFYIKKKIFLEGAHHIADPNSIKIS